MIYNLLRDFQNLNTVGLLNRNSDSSHNLSLRLQPEAKYQRDHGIFTASSNSRSIECLIKLGFHKIAPVATIVAVVEKRVLTQK